MSFFSNLNPRERLLVGLVLPLAVIGAGYRLGWVPLTEARNAREAEIAGYRTILATVDALGDRAGDAPATAAAAAPAARDPLPSRITRSADAAGLDLRRLDPEGDRLRVSIDMADYEAVLGWIAAMERDEGIAVAAIEMERRVEPGTVSARVTLEDM